MKSNFTFFNKYKTLPVDKFFRNVLYNKKNGYYTSKNPFGKDGDFITAPKISRLYSEIIAIWIISAWEIFNKPKNFNIVELGPGDGSMMKDLLKTFELFSEFNLSKKIFLYEKSSFLIRKQKTLLKKFNVKWISDFKKIKKGPIIFFGNEFFDAIPIKQFKRSRNLFLEKHFTLKKNYRIEEIYKNALKEDIKMIKSFKSLNKQKFIEFPKFGLKELEKITNKILKTKGCILILDYGYFKANNNNSLQSVFRHKKNNLLKKLGKADITSHVNFELLNEFFLKKNLKVKKIVTQKKFLQKMGILERAEIVARKMNFKEKADLYLRLKRLMDDKYMGSLFKVFLAYNFKSNNFYGFN